MAHKREITELADRIAERVGALLANCRANDVAVEDVIIAFGSHAHCDEHGVERYWHVAVLFSDLECDPNAHSDKMLSCAKQLVLITEAGMPAAGPRGEG